MYEKSNEYWLRMTAPVLLVAAGVVGLAMKLEESSMVTDVPRPDMLVEGYVPVPTEISNKNGIVKKI